MVKNSFSGLKIAKNEKLPKTSEKYFFSINNDIPKVF